MSVSLRALPRASSLIANLSGGHHPARDTHPWNIVCACNNPLINYGNKNACTVEHFPNRIVIHHLQLCFPPGSCYGSAMPYDARLWWSQERVNGRKDVCAVRRLTAQPRHRSKRTRQADSRIARQWQPQAAKDEQKSEYRQ